MYMEQMQIVFQLKSLSFVNSFRGDGVIRQAQGTGISGIEVFRIIVGVLTELSLSDQFLYEGRWIDSRQVEERIKSTGWTHTLKTENIAFQLGGAGVLEQSFIIIKELTANAAKSWDAWILPFFKIREFTQAWISNVEYDRWQNAKDPLEYESAGRSYSQLKMISNNLPPPLEQKVIDTSTNPGRWELRPGYVEAIGSTMWLGDAFWKRVGDGRKNHAMASDDLNIDLLENGIVRLQAATGCFASEVTKEIQNKLRAILYE
jgi:hypothetical protein